MNREDRPPRQPLGQRPVTDSRQRPLFDVRQFRPHPYQPASFFGVLERFGELLIRRDDFPGGADTGTAAWCHVLLSKLVIIQRYNGWTDRETVDRATNDLRVKACLGLGVEQKGPSQPKLSVHRARMKELGLLDVYEQRFVALVKLLGLLDDHEPLLIDSAPVRGAGQVLDAYNLIAAAIRRGLGRLAEARREPVAALAERLELTVFMERSVKGRFDVDWEDPVARRAFLAELVVAAERLLDAIDAQVTQRELDDSDSTPADDDERGAGASGRLAEAASVLREILDREVERGSDGEVTGLVQRPAGDRIISATDPDMRHGRKSASVLIRGYKVQIMASVVFGWILLARVFRANQHDGAEVIRWVDELGERHGLEPEWLAGDHAYGTLANHAAFARSGPKLIARMARPQNGGRFTKDQFDIDFTTATLTCPAGHCQVRSRYATNRGRKGWLFEFPAALCRACPSRADCVSPRARAGRTVFVCEPEERLIRDHLERRLLPDFQDKLAQRVHVERVIAGFAQCGGKRVRRFRQQQADFDVRLSALAYNLRRLGALVRDQPELRRRLERLLDAHRGRERVSSAAASLDQLAPGQALLAMTILIGIAIRRRLSAPLAHSLIGYDAPGRVSFRRVGRLQR